MISRHYSYQLGRFHQPDPVNGSISSPMSWNLYTYVQNNPLNYIDPFGLAKRGTTATLSSTQCSSPEEEQEIKEIECQMQGGTWKFGTCFYDFGFAETVVVVPACPACEAAKEAQKQFEAEFLHDVFDKSWAQLGGFSKFFKREIYAKPMRGIKNFNNKSNPFQSNELFPRELKGTNLNIPQESIGNPIPTVPRSSHLTISDKILVAITQFLSTLVNTGEFFITGPLFMPQIWINDKYKDKECELCI